MAEHTCQFLDMNDVRCSSRFCLDHLDDMFDMCVGGGESRCVMFHRLRMEQEQGPLVNQAPTPSPTPVLMTSNGSELQLRPTGS